MRPKNNVTIKALFVSILSGLSFIFALLLLVSTQPVAVVAQAPLEDNSSLIQLSDESLAALGLSTASLQASSTITFDLQILKRTQAVTVTPGAQITFTISITNNGPNSVSNLLFKDTPPSQMQNISYLFNTTAVSDGLSPPTWLLSNALAANNRILITVTGILTSQSSITVTNQATVNAFNATGELTPTNNTSAAAVGIKGATGPISMTVYLPIILKPIPEPTIVLAYLEDFNSGNPWIVFDANGCKTRHQSAQYWVEVDSSNRECLPPAKDTPKPESPNRTYGVFEVDAYHSGEIQSDAAYGLFLNGSGGDNYYVFRIWPNNGCTNGGGNWELRRKRNNNEVTLISDICQTVINRGFGIGATNKLKVIHKNDRTLSVYVNNVPLGSIQDNATDHLTGTGTGIFTRSTNKDILIKFDNFKVSKFQ